MCFDLLIKLSSPVNTKEEVVEEEVEEEEEGSDSLTDVEDSLFGRVLSRVPVLPVFKLLVSVLIFAEHHHDHTLRRKNKTGQKWDESQPNNGQVLEQGYATIRMEDGSWV